MPEPDNCEVSLEDVRAAIQDNRALIDEVGSLVRMLLHAPGNGINPHPDDYPGGGAHQLGIGPTGIVNSLSITKGKVFTTISGSGPTTWTERVVIEGSDVSTYVGQVDYDWTSGWSSTPPSEASQAATAMANYISALSGGAGSMSTTYSYIYQSVPSTESSTPSGSTTYMYRVKVQESGSWNEQGLMFREVVGGKSFRDYWLLDSGYNSNVKDETVRLEVITSGTQYYTDRKTFIEAQHASYGYHIAAIYSFITD